MRIAILALLALVACSDSYLARTEPKYAPDGGGPCGRVFRVDPAFPDSEKAALERAVSRWNAISTEKFCLAPGDGNERTGTHTIFRMHDGGDEWRQVAGDGGHVIGVHWSIVDRIALVDSLNDTQFELTALHEFGHAHGLGHTEAPAIMYYMIGTADDFTPIDMAECRHAGACGPEKSLLPGGVSEESVCVQ